MSCPCSAPKCHNFYLLLFSFGPNAVSKGGGKAFDVEVEVKDPYAFDLLECVNDISRSQKEIMETISTVRNYPGL